MLHKDLLNFTFRFWILSVHLISVVWTTDDGWPQVVGSSQPIVATLGDDIILPCHVEPQLNAERLTVSWWRPDLPPEPGDPLSQYKYVHRYHDNHDAEDLKLSAYAGRTALGAEGLKHGDVSLKITSVRLSDQGRYRCHIPQLGRASIIKLVVEPKPVKMWPTETPALPTSLQTTEPKDETVTTGWPQVVGSSQPIVAALGDDIILPCHAEPQLNAERLTVSWWRPDLPPDPGDPLSQYKYVHRYHDNHDAEDLKMSAYAGRTALGAEGLKHGDVSLKITSVKLSDHF